MQKQKDPRFLKAQLRLAAGVWRETKDNPLPADRCLSRFFFQNRKKIGSRDRRFISEAVFGAFRHKSFLEAWLEKAKPKPVLSDHESAEFFCLLAAAKEGLIDALDFCENGGLSGKVFEALRGHLLPEIQGPQSRPEMLALLYSFPVWLVERWCANFGPIETEKLLAFLDARPALVLRVNTLKISREKLLDVFRREGIEANPTSRSPSGVVLKDRRNVLDTAAFRDGWFEVQDEGSQLVGQKMEARPGESIWDVCAGGGGKSLLLAAMMENKGRIVATDLRAYKLEELKKRAKRGGIFNIFPADLERMSGLATAKKGFDRILVDAPCSGTGTFGRNPDAKWKVRPSWFEDLPREQTGIVEKALPYLKKNGKLYYATCSVEAAENEAVVERVLERHPELALVPCGDGGGKFFRLWPPESGTDGFFLAVMEKIRN